MFSILCLSFYFTYGLDLEKSDFSLYEFHPEVQALKLYEQIECIIKSLDDEFNTAGSDPEMRFTFLQGCSIFNLKEGTELVANAFLFKKIYYTIKKDSGKMVVKESDLKKQNCIEIYSLLVTEKYRGKGIVGPFLSTIINRMAKRFKLDKETLIGLHLNPDDRMMYFSFALYIKYGFEKASICRRGPSDFQFLLEKISTLRHPIEVARSTINKEEINAQENLFAMYTKIKNFRRSNSKVDMKELTNLGRRLKEALLSDR